MEVEERQGRTTYGTIGFRSGMRLGGRIADPNMEAGSSSGEELEIEENEVAVPIPVPS